MTPNDPRGDEPGQRIGTAHQPVDAPPGWLRCDDDGGVTLGPVVLDADPTAPGEARRAIASLEQLTSPGCAQDVELLVSELVTNAVLHTSSRRLAITARVADDTVRVEVTDAEGGSSPRTAHTSPSVPGGLGLRIVDRLADRWGTRSDPPAKTVWFDLAVTPAA